MVIAIVALVVFGPQRLPELARKAADLLKQARQATQSLTDALDTEYDGVTAPLKDLKAEYDETMQTIKKMAPTTPNLSFELPDGKPKKKTEEKTEDGRQKTEEEAEGEPSAEEEPSADENEDSV